MATTYALISYLSWNRIYGTNIYILVRYILSFIRLSVVQVVLVSCLMINSWSEHKLSPCLGMSKLLALCGWLRSHLKRKWNSPDYSKQQNKHQSKGMLVTQNLFLHSRNQSIQYSRDASGIYKVEWPVVNLSTKGKGVKNSLNLVNVVYEWSFSSLYLE